MISLAPRRKRMLYVLIAVLVVAAYFGAVAFWLDRDDSAARGRFEITPTDSDIGGVLVGSGFLIRPAEGDTLTPEDLKGQLKVSPVIAYSLEAAEDGAVLLQPEPALTPGDRLTFTCGRYSAAFSVRQELAVVSVEPRERGGVALDEPIVITFNQAVTVSAGDNILISPRVKGSWSADGERLIFTPKRYENGTVYTVTIAGELITDGSLRPVAMPVTAAFETQNTADRLPAAETFDVAAEELAFAPDEPWSIPVACVGDGEPALTAELWFTGDGSRYTAVAQELLGLADYAVLARDNWQADTDGWQSLGVIDGETVADGTSFECDGRAAGYYLLRLTMGHVSRMLVVTVSGLDGIARFDGDTLLLWAHENGRPAAGAVATLNDHTTTLDENGSGTLETVQSAELTGWLHLQSDNGERWLYLGDASAATVRASLRGVLIGAGSFRFGGAVTSLNGAAMRNVAVLLCSEAGELCRTTAEVDENGLFAGELTGEPLMDGVYTLRLECGGQLVAATTVTVGQSPRQAVTLTATPSAVVAEEGAEVVFTVTARDDNGQPVSGLTITSSVDADVRHETDKKGMATFYQRFYLPQAMTSLRYGVTFSAEPGDGSTVTADAFVRVGEAQNSPAALDETDDDSLTLNRTENGLSLPGSGTPSLRLTYDVATGVYAVEPAAVPAMAGGLTGQTVAAGENAEYALTLTAPGLMVLSLYDGAGGDGAPVLQRAMALGDGAVSLALPTDGLRGDYTVVAECLNGAGATVAEAPLTITGEEAPASGNVDQSGSGLLFFEVTEGVAEDAALTCFAAAEDADAARRLLEINLLPGNQLLQVMGRHSLARAGITLPVCGSNDGDVTALQNSDGSFSRLVGGAGDLLLCALVARDQTLICNRSALHAYAAARLADSTDSTARTLAYWVLASLGDDILQPLKNLVGNKELKLRDQLYLAESLLAAGDRATADLVYGELAATLRSEGDRRWLASESDQDTFLCTLLMADLSIRLERGDESALLAYLLQNDMEIMTNRYLLSECLLAVVAGLHSSGEAGEGEVALSALAAPTVELPPILRAVLSVNGEERAEIAPGELAALTLRWPGSESSTTLYLVAFRLSEHGRVCETDTVRLQNGCAMAIVKETELTVMLRAQSAGALCGDVFVMNLTTGKIIGSVAGDTLGVTV